MLKFENKLNGRFYYIEIKKDLFGDLVINTIRGGRNISLQRIIFCDNAGSIRDKIREISQRRISRGYTLIQ